MSDELKAIPGGVDIWGTYSDRLGLKGETYREYEVGKERRYLTRHGQNSLIYNKVLIDGEPFDVAIIRGEEFDEKRIVAFPGQKLKHGGLVELNIDGSTSKWLITEIDAMDEISSRGTMERCNYVLRWLNNDGELIERDARIVDGTKYLVGVEGNKIMEIGTARIAVTVTRDSETLKLRRGKRFLIDDMESDEVMAFEINKANRFFNVFDGSGVFRYIMGECNIEDGDNLELHIANYYDWKPQAERIESDVSADRESMDLQDIVSDNKIEKESKANTVETTNNWL